MSQTATGESIGTLYYFGDPMCSWCWGLKPVLEQLDAEYPELRRRTVMGGLRDGPEVPMGDELAEMIQGAWRRIHDGTGQPFNHDLWAQHRPLATTLPACRAVVAARTLDPAREWPFMVGMFKAYFTEARDPSSTETHCDVAEQVGLERAAFAEALESGRVEEALQADLKLTRRFGITGFPTLVLGLEHNHYLISPGYQPIDAMRRAINEAYADAGVDDYQRPESGMYV